MISVIVPVYNASNYLRKCVNSILNQTFKQFELILIDDGSTDNSGKICDEYLLYDSRCKVIHQKNQGVSEARNTGIKNIDINTEYITFIDNDDVIHPNYLEFLYRAINEGKYKIALCLFECRKQTNANFTLGECTYKTYEITRDYLFSGIFTKLSNIKYIDGLTDSVVWGSLYHKDLIKNNLFKPLIGEDIEFNSRILLTVDKVIVVSANLYFCIRREGCLSNNPKLSVYYDKSTLARTFEVCLNNIPKNFLNYRAFALIGLFKAILSSKYDISNKNLEKLLEVKKTYKKHRKEYRLNPYIPFNLKWGILLMSQFPILYKLYRYLRSK